MPSKQRITLWFLSLQISILSSVAYHNSLYKRNIILPSVLKPVETNVSSDPDKSRINNFSILQNDRLCENVNHFNHGSVWKRMFDTMGAAGFKGSSVSSMTPKRAFIIFVAMMAFKWFRAKVILKQNFMEKQPAWGHVITSKDQEKDLHAWSCKYCGATMFIAKGREIRFFNSLVGIECETCGAKGKESFIDRREEIVAEDDIDFQYENPMDYISNAERKKLMKKTEEEKIMNEKSQDVIDVVVLDESTSEGSSDVNIVVPASVAISNNIEESSKKPESDDDIDVLEMDL